MNQDWQNFLATQGAQIEAGTVRHFGDAAAERAATQEGTVLCDLSHFGVLRVSGEDAESFLQNLLSNDIREVTPNRAQLSSFNTAKGRMLASFVIWREVTTICCSCRARWPNRCARNCRCTCCAAR